MMRLGVLLAVAVALEGCGNGGEERPAKVEPTQRHGLVLVRAPYMGVACPTPNSIACDRVGLAVWLEKRATRLTVSIAGREVRMRSPGQFVAGKGRGWEGYLHPAGLIDGPLKVVRDAGPNRWTGRMSVSVPVSVTARYGDGNSETSTVRVYLHPGWG